MDLHKVPKDSVKRVGNLGADLNSDCSKVCGTGDRLLLDIEGVSAGEGFRTSSANVEVVARDGLCRIVRPVDCNFMCGNSEFI